MLILATLAHLAGSGLGSHGGLNLPHKDERAGPRYMLMMLITRSDPVCGCRKGFISQSSSFHASLE